LILALDAELIAAAFLLLPLAVLPPSFSFPADMRVSWISVSIEGAELQAAGLPKRLRVKIV
jgi:hypothetical protein